MIVSTEDKDLKLVMTNNAKMVKTFGAVRAKFLVRRIQKLMNARNLEELRNEAGHFHELVDNRKGQWACDLDQPYRLIFEPKEKPIPTDPNGKYIWIEIKAVELVEVVNYHGK